MRTLSALNTAQLTSRSIAPVFFLSITFLSGPMYLCTAPFNITWGGFTWLGVGDLGEIGTISEGTGIQAQGTTVTLNAIDNSLLQDSLNDIGALQPAAIFWGFMNQQMTLVDTPIKIWGGVVDTAIIASGPEQSSITLTLENRMVLLQRGSQRRYTRTDQRLYYPTDSAFDSVESLNDVANRWG
jgi:hypothetical protein